MPNRLRHERCVRDMNDVIGFISEKRSGTLSHRSQEIFLAMYLLREDAIPNASKEAKEARILSFQASCPKTISAECRRLLAMK